MTLPWKPPEAVTLKMTEPAGLGLEILQIRTSPLKWLLWSLFSSTRVWGYNMDDEAAEFGFSSQPKPSHICLLLLMEEGPLNLGGAI